MKKVVLISLISLCCIFFSSCGCSYRWVEVIGHYYKPRHYEQYNGRYYSYGQWVEEQKLLRVKCACGTTDIIVEEPFYYEVKNGDSIYWNKAEQTVKLKPKSW